MNDFDSMLCAAKIDQDRVESAMAERKPKRYRVCAFPAYRGDPWYFSIRIVALVAARFRLGIFFPHYAEVRVIDTLTDEHIAVY